jgi:hypothetical protein
LKKSNFLLTHKNHNFYVEEEEAGRMIGRRSLFAHKTQRYIQSILKTGLITAVNQNRPKPNNTDRLITVLMTTKTSDRYYTTIRPKVTYARINIPYFAACHTSTVC